MSRERGHRSSILCLTSTNSSPQNTIQALAWAPHGNLLTRGSRDQTVRVFDIRSMKEWVVLCGHKKWSAHHNEDGRLPGAGQLIEVSTQKLSDATNSIR
ncbi:hypothetical protein BGW80DRAFT_1456432 [Lactifluus volemus]|nr:hypothetical protein BGW80DRAFT_1456432 [Lactifluus volemus]